MKLMHRLLFAVRDLRCRKMFVLISQFTSGKVLDVGGGEFYTTAIKKKIVHEKWVNVDTIDQNIEYTDPRYSFIKADASQLPFQNKSLIQLFVFKY